MSLHGLFRAFISARSTILFLCLLALLLLLNVALPQENVVGAERFAEMTVGRPVAHFVLVTLGLGRMSVSPVFLTVLALFLLNLLTVLVARIGPAGHPTRAPDPKGQRSPGRTPSEDLSAEQQGTSSWLQDTNFGSG